MQCGILDGDTMIPPIFLFTGIAIVIVLFCLGFIVWIAGLCDLLDRVTEYIDDMRSTL